MLIYIAQLRKLLYCTSTKR